jgi:DNA-directed RNA polymerase specialized sigma24 family protein
MRIARPVDAHTWAGGMMNLSDFELKALLRSCVEGDADSRVKFQNVFGELIYNYPIRVFHLPNDRAADFYIYIFENDRIFRRVKSFEARNDAQFTTYLQFYVLRDLFLEWRRGQKEADTISLATAVSSGSGDSSGTLEDILSDPGDTIEKSLDAESKALEFKALFEKLAPERKLLLKLLHLAEFDLSPQEIRLLCKKSGRSYRDIIFDLEEIRARLRKKDEQLSNIQARLESVYGWILLYQKELGKISQRLSSLTEDSPQFAEMRQQKEGLERKLEWRYRQRSQILGQADQFRVTTPYKDIARLFNAPIGTICSLVARTRTEVSTTVDQLNDIGVAAAT